MSRHRFVVSRRVALGLAAGPLLVAAPPRAFAQPRLDKVSFLTNWRAQAEHGGYYQAQAAGLYREHGLEVDLRSGGPQINPSQLLLGGRVDMAMGNGLGALNLVRENIPFCCIGAIFQKDMTVVIGHPGTLPNFAALRGRPMLISAEPRVTWYQFLKQKYQLREEQVRPYTFNLQPFLADRTVVQQGYLGSEPFSIRQAGVNPDVLLVHDAGYEDYGETIHISRRMIAEKREVVQRFVDASMKGWDQYLKGQGSEGANRLIKAQNPDMGDDLLAFGTRMMNEHGIVRGGEAAQNGIGAMSEARWGPLFQTLVSVGVMPANLDWKRAYDLSFVNKGIGRA